MSLIADDIDLGQGNGSFGLSFSGLTDYTWGFFQYVMSTEDVHYINTAEVQIYIWDGVFNLYSSAYFDIYTTLPAEVNKWYFVGYSVESEVNVTFFATLVGSNTVDYVTTTTSSAFGQGYFVFGNGGHFGCIKHWHQALSNAQIQQEATQFKCFTDPYIWIPMLNFNSLADQGRNLRGAGNSLLFDSGATISTLNPPIPLGIPSIPFAPRSAVAPPPYFASPLMLLAC